jgi:hypothetical protein
MFATGRTRRISLHPLHKIAPPSRRSSQPELPASLNAANPSLPRVRRNDDQQILHATSATNRPDSSPMWAGPVTPGAKPRRQLLRLHISPFTVNVMDTELRQSVITQLRLDGADWRSCVRLPRASALRCIGRRRECGTTTRRLQVARDRGARWGRGLGRFFTPCNQSESFPTPGCAAGDLSGLTVRGPSLGHHCIEAVVGAFPPPAATPLPWRLW